MKLVHKHHHHDKPSRFWLECDLQVMSTMFLCESWVFFKIKAFYHDSYAEKCTTTLIGGMVCNMEWFVEITNFALVYLRNPRFLSSRRCWSMH